MPSAHPPARLPPRTRLRRWLIAGSLVGLATLAALVWLSPAARLRSIGTALWVEARVRPAHLTEFQRSLDPWIPSRAVILSGDSLIAMLPARWVDEHAVNFGVGAATVGQIRAQLHGLRSPATARALVLLLGTNDVVHRPLAAAEADLRALLAALPASLPVLLCTVPPVDPLVHRDRSPDTIARFNERWAACAAARPGTRLVRVETVLADAAGHLPASLHQGDGLHLNAEGNRRLAALLRATLAALVP